MARDSSGNYSLPGSAFVAGQTADAAAMNAKLADIAAEIADSLSRSGKGGMTVPLRFPDGSETLPAVSFSQETGTGWYRAAAGDIRLAILGVDVLTLASTGGPYGLWGRAVAASDTTNNSTAASTDIDGLTFSCLSGKRYLVRGVFYTYAAASTTGFGVGPKATGAPTVSTFDAALRYWDGVASAWALVGVNDFSNTPDKTATSSNIATVPFISFFEGQFVTTSTGTFQMGLITEVNASAVTCKAGSYIEWACID